ncbi:MAG: serine/threonine protein phosphatase [Ruminococcus sp.]|nr:serine/threonine protein phosphatase [Ruminococcus sp.]
MSIFNRIKNDKYQQNTLSAAARFPRVRFLSDNESFESSVYETLRDTVPLVDACISKIVRLAGDFKVRANTQRAQKALDEFVKNVPVGISGRSLGTFADMYLDSLLTYGKSIGEYVVDADSGRISSLYVCDPTLFRVRVDKNTGSTEFVFNDDVNKKVPFANPERILYTALNPTPKCPEGRSLLKGLPVLADILSTIYSCIGNNFERAGNLRYAVTYKPGNDTDMQFAKKRASDMAAQWTDGMQSAKNGIMKDFLAVGDVDIKVIGAESGLIQTEVPVRQIIEQMISKLSIPPFLLGLNWSSTERMASQQADILTSELEYYRRLLSPVLEKICRTFLSLEGVDDEVEIVWANINLQDEEALARARLYNAQAQEIENRSGKEDTFNGYAV